MSLEIKSELEQLGAERAGLIQDVQSSAATIRSEGRDYSAEELQTQNEKTSRIEAIDKRGETLRSLQKVEALSKQNEQQVEATRSASKSYSVMPSERECREAFKAWCLHVRLIAVVLICSKAK